MKKYIAILLAVVINFMLVINAYAKENTKYSAELELTNQAEHNVNARSAVLMEASTGKILYSLNENESYSPASVTKVMTLLLIMEALNSGVIRADENVTVSAYAASMGGSQIFLEEGEEMSVEELIKSTVIASANDAAVALAEHVAGSEKLFVSKMNKRAAELGLKNTYFENVTGLDDTTEKHLTSALDIAIMSRELIRYDLIRRYSTKWQDTIRNGEFTLTNTNRLVRYYDGCTGLKTGSTDKAGYCLSATAKRDGMELIAVIMGAETRDVRNAEARALLDFGFANYSLYRVPERLLKSVPVISGEKSFADLYSSPFEAVIEKGRAESVETVQSIPDSINAPISKNDVLGRVEYKLDGISLGCGEVYLKESIGKVSVSRLFVSILRGIFS